MKVAPTILASFAAASLAAAPAMAATTARASAPAERTNGMESGAIIGVFGVAAVVALAIIAATNNDNSPVSP